jgi:hypothetical protein
MRIVVFSPMDSSWKLAVEVEEQQQTENACCSFSPGCLLASQIPLQCVVAMLKRSICRFHVDLQLVSKSAYSLFLGLVCR